MQAIHQAIAALKEERSRIDTAITGLERVSNGQPANARVGRKWPKTARRAAAKRMRKYWAKRRKKA